MNFKKDVSLADYISFKLGGKAKYFLVAKKKQDIIEAVKTAKENGIPFFILAGGANVLVPDEGIDGLVIKTLNTKYKILDTKIMAEAGVLLGDIAKTATENSLSGLEWAAGIPGRIGGAVYGNAQAFGSNMASIVDQVEALNAEDMSVKVYSNKECGYLEKTSIFKKNKNLIILSASLLLKKGDRNKIRDKMEEYLGIRKSRHPLEYPSAGSVFVNDPSRPASSYLIEQAGLKGFRIGGAQVSEKHSGFIVNKGGATCKDVLNLISKIKKTVKDKTGFDLEQEIQILGYPQLTKPVEGEIIR